MRKWICLFVFGCLVILGGCQKNSDSVTKTEESFVVLLGTGTPNAEPDRSGPATAVVSNGHAYIVDCGPGIVRRANAAFQKGIDALEPSNLNVLFLTHLHTDHTTGFPDLLFTPWVLERSVPLEVYGPKGTKEMVDHILAAYEQDIRARLEGKEPANPEGYRVNVHIIEPGLIHEDNQVKVISFPVHHGAWGEAYGFRFETKDRVFVISGDRAPAKAIDEFCEDCDVLIHEAYSVQGFKRRTPDWQAYHADAHTSTHELAELANRVQPGKVVMTHQLLWGTSPDEMLAELRSRYNGPVFYGKDLEVY